MHVFGVCLTACVCLAFLCKYICTHVYVSTLIWPIMNTCAFVSTGQILNCLTCGHTCRVYSCVCPSVRCGERERGHVSLSDQVMKAESRVGGYSALMKLVARFSFERHAVLFLL